MFQLSKFGCRIKNHQRKFVFRYLYSFKALTLQDIKDRKGFNDFFNVLTSFLSQKAQELLVD